MSLLETGEFLSYAVTVVGLPFAILVYLFEKKKERENEEEEIYQKLSDEYADFLKLILENSDLQLRHSKVEDLSEEQKERRTILFDLLISLFERAYILAYAEDMNRAQRRRWQSWEDYMVEWCAREDFRRQLPRLLEGEDEDFVRYIVSLAKKKDPSFGVR
jgi:hypothetical protein